MNLKSHGNSSQDGRKLPQNKGFASGSDPYEAAQLEDLSAIDRARRDADSWRRVASAALLVSCGLVLACIVLASKSQHDVLVYRETSRGLSYQNEALQMRTPSQLAIEAQLASFIKAVRNVPGVDYALDDQNVGLALQMTVDASPAHANQDIRAYFLNDGNNPKKLGMAGEVRTVLEPVIASPISAQTWTVSWAEETTLAGRKPTRAFHQGTLTIAPPSIPTDPQVAVINPAGVAIEQFDLHLGEH